MRVLILADECNPEWPSLPVVGYAAARAIAEHVDVVVATHIRNRTNLEKVGLGRAQVRYLDNEYVARPMANIGRLLRRGAEVGWTTAVTLNYPSYLAFEWEAWRATRDELRRGEFDLVHRLTPMSPTIPSPMASWSPVPFVLGPLNGGLKWPAAFRQERARELEWLSYLRSAHRALPYWRSTYRDARAVLAAFQHTIDDLPPAAQSKIVNFPEVGINPTLFAGAAKPPPQKQKVVIFAGRLVPLKLSQIVIQAFADRPALRRHRLLIVGDGPERPAMERLIERHQLEAQVQMLGWKSQADVAALMRTADIFAFPSIRELGAGVVVEAMACGLACVVVDYGGPATLIGPDRGVKVPLGNRERIRQEFAEALERLVLDDEAIMRLGAAARDHALRFYTWDAKARKTIEVYEWVLGRRERPNFWQEG